MLKLTTEEFIARATKRHQGRYSYQGVAYVSSRIHIVAMCPAHGKFSVAPAQHLLGRGCRLCALASGGEKRASKAGIAFFKTAEKTHAGKGYTYPEDYVAAKTKLPIVCPLHGVFWQTPSAHARGAGCPTCEDANKGERNRLRGSKIGEQFEARAKLVHGDKYRYNEVEYVKATAAVFIICNTHGRFSQTPHSHLSGKGCPKCGSEATKAANARKNELSKAEFVLRAVGIHGDRYDYSRTEYMNSTTLVEIGCHKHGYFLQLPQPHLQGKGCAECGKEEVRKPPIPFSEFLSRAQTAHGDEYQYLEKSYTKLSDKVEITCGKHGPFTQLANSHARGCGCPECGKSKTGQEDALEAYVLGLGVQATRNDRTLICPKELDLLVPDRRVAIEYCGLYWHRSSNPTAYENVETPKDKNYHVDKLEDCTKAGYRLITILGDEWEGKEQQVKAILARTLVPQTLSTIGARECSVGPIQSAEAKAFLDQAHLSGFAPAELHIGLELRGDLVAVASFSSSRTIFGSTPVEGRIELVRFSQKPGWLIHGSLQRLCKAAFSFDRSALEIFSYVDRRWFTGRGYLNAGFILLGASQPGYWYSKGTKRFHRYVFAKHKLQKLLPVFSPDKTEKENMLDNGYFTIHDCGQLKMLLKK